MHMQPGCFLIHTMMLKMKKVIYWLLMDLEIDNRSYQYMNLISIIYLSYRDTMDMSLLLDCYINMQRRLLV